MGFTTSCSVHKFPRFEELSWWKQFYAHAAETGCREDCVVWHSDLTKLDSQPVGLKPINLSKQSLSYSPCVADTVELCGGKMKRDSVSSWSVCLSQYQYQKAIASTNLETQESLQKTGIPNIPEFQIIGDGGFWKQKTLSAVAREQRSKLHDLRLFINGLLLKVTHSHYQTDLSNRECSEMKNSLHSRIYSKVLPLDG